MEAVREKQVTAKIEKGKGESKFSKRILVLSQIHKKAYAAFIFHGDRGEKQLSAEIKKEGRSR